MAKGKANVKKAKAVREGGARKGDNLEGKGKRIATGPPGTPQGKHHAVLAKEGICHCGRCRNDRLVSV